MNFIKYDVPAYTARLNTSSFEERAAAVVHGKSENTRTVELDRLHWICDFCGFENVVLSLSCCTCGHHESHVRDNAAETTSIGMSKSVSSPNR